MTRVARSVRALEPPVTRGAESSFRTSGQRVANTRILEPDPRHNFGEHRPGRPRPDIDLCFVRLLQRMARPSRREQSLAHEGIPQPSPGVVELMRLQARIEKILGQVQPVARVLNPPNEYTSSTSSA